MMLTLLIIQLTMNHALALQTYTSVTRLRAVRGGPLQCTESLLNNDSVEYKDLGRETCSVLTDSIHRSPELTIEDCKLSRIVCDDGLPLVSSRLDIVSENNDVTSRQLHEAFRTAVLAKETTLSIDYMQIKDFNECAGGEHNCHSNALCKNSMGTYMCTCKRGYVDVSLLTGRLSGKVCEVHCGSNSCKNMGTCGDVDGHPVCKCTNGYTGKSCQVRKKDIEWIWILAATLVVGTLLVVPALACLCIYIRAHRKTKTLNCYKSIS